MIRLGDTEYSDSYGTLSPYYLHRIAYGLAGGLSAAYAFSSRLNLTVTAEDAVYQLQQKAVTLLTSPDWETLSVEAPSWHEFTVSAAVSVRVL